jgi:hypothetical protein
MYSSNKDTYCVLFKVLHKLSVVPTKALYFVIFSFLSFISVIFSLYVRSAQNFVLRPVLLRVKALIVFTSHIEPPVPVAARSKA